MGDQLEQLSMLVRRERLGFPLGVELIKPTLQLRREATIYLDQQISLLCWQARGSTPRPEREHLGQKPI